MKTVRMSCTFIGIGSFYGCIDFTIINFFSDTKNIPRAWDVASFHCFWYERESRRGLLYTLNCIIICNNGCVRGIQVYSKIIKLL